MISTEDIVLIVQNILRTMLELEAIPTELVLSERRFDRVTGCIQISGQWQGAVVIQGSEELARLFGCRLLECDSESLSDDDIRDAFAEMTNMIGGNIKGQVPCPSFLSIPSVTTGHDFDFYLSGAIVIREVAFDCHGEMLRILMCEEDRSLSNRLTQRKGEFITR
jgi:chemotaxis protein CheX